MNQNILTGIGIGAAVCAAGIVYSPSIPTTPEAAALFAGIIGALALMTAAGRHHSAPVGIGATGILLIGGFAIATGILTGPAAILAAVLVAGAALLLGRTLLRGEAPGQRLPGGGCT